MALASALSAFFVMRPALARAYSSPGKPTGFVNDFANVIDDASQASMEQDLSAFASETSNEIVVATVNSLKGDSIENYTNQLFREWGLGDKDRNNGVLLLVSPSDRKVRIEVGYGLEGAITDLETSRIIEAEALPSFRENDYAKGIIGSVQALKTAARGEYAVPPPKNSKSSFSMNSIFFGFWLLIWLSSFLARSKSWWAGGLIGGIIGGLGWLLLGSVAAKISLTIMAPLLGLFLDWLVSRNYQKNISKGGSGGFFPTIGGFSGGSSSSGGGGFGGFSGGSSGGGGSSGSW